MFPKPVIGKDGNPIETKTARLLKSVITGKFIAHGFEEPNRTVELVDSDKPEPQVIVDDVQATIKRVDSRLPGGSVDQVENTVEKVAGSVHLQLVDISDGIKTISSDESGSDGSDDDSDIVERVQIHSLRPVCNASVMFNRL